MQFSTVSLTVTDGKTWINADIVLRAEAALDSGGGFLVGDDDEHHRSWTQYMPPWYQQAECSGIDEDVSFGNKDLSVRPSLTLTELKKAQTYCAHCPVYRECLTHALTTPEEYGVWGGTSRNMRLKLLKAVDSGLILLTDVIEELCKIQERIKSRG